MLIHQGVYLPDGETHLVEWMTRAGEIVDGRGSYQIRKLREALSHVKQFRVAVDVGAHCGLWSMQLVKRFAKVHAFEPVAEHRDCFLANLADTDIGRFSLYHSALGDHDDMIKITTAPTSSGDSYVDGSGDIPMHTLDSFNLQDVDFIKIDTEGHELPIIRGGEQTIKRCKPVIIVEQKGHGMTRYGFRKEEAAELLESWGMKRVANLSGDIILIWP